MKLKKYLKGKNVPEFADSVPVTTAAVYHWMNGTRHPRREQANRIVKLTGGDVTLEDIYE
jgi:hypothetical protein